MAPTVSITPLAKIENNAANEQKKTSFSLFYLRHYFTMAMLEPSCAKARSPSTAEKGMFSFESMPAM